MDAITGYYRRGTASDEIGRSSETTALHSHSGVNRATGTVQDGILYSRQTLIQGSVLQAHLRADDAIADTLRELLEEASETGLWRVGTGLTRGMGRLRLTRTALLDAPFGTVASIRTRVEQFDHHVRQHADRAAVTMPHARYVALTLYTDVLLPDRSLAWRGRLDERTLAQVDLPGADLVYHTTRLVRIMGWDTALGLPRADALAISKGSVFVFGFAHEPDDAALEALQRTAIGVRREGGFGRVIVSDPFHWEVVNA